MTVNVNDTIERYVIAGVGPYPYTWRIFNDSDLQVHAVSTASPPSPTLLATPSDYTVAGANVSSGGSITLTAAAAATYAGYTLDIRSNTPENQPTSIRNTARFLPEIHENAYDYLSRQIQDLNRRVDAKIGYPDNEALSGTVPTAAARKGFYLFWDTVTGALTTAVLSATTMTQQIIGQLLNPQTAAEAVVGVVPTNYWHKAYIRGRYANFTQWRLACDQAGAEGELDADYAITATTYLPKKSDFKGFKITGLFQTIHAYHGSVVNPGYGWVKDWRASRPFIAGTYACEYTNVDTLGDANVDKLLIMGGDGVSANTGCFWNRISLAVVGQTEINADRADVNQNTITGGISRYVHLTGGAGGAGQIHENEFFRVDMSHSGGAPASSGYLQDDETRAKNFLTGLYYENGVTQIRGNVDINKFQGDAQGMPLADRRNHIMGTVGINPRLKNDFIATTNSNLVRGGNWNWLDSTGKPPGFTNIGGASVAVVVDPTEPGGAGKRYEATFADAFDQFNITVQPSGGTQSGGVIFYKSTADFVAIQSDYAGSGGATSFDTEPVVLRDAAGVPTGWKMIRLSCPSSPTVTLGVVLLAYGGVGGAAKVMSLGSVRFGSELAVMHPGKNDEEESFRYTPTLTAVTNVAASTAYPMQVTRVGNTVTVDGRVDVDPTLAAPTATEIGISLPIAPGTAFSLADQCVGNGTSLDWGQCGPVFADAANNRASLRFRATNVANDSWGVHFSYRMY